MARFHHNAIGGAARDGIAEGDYAFQSETPQIFSNSEREKRLRVSFYLIEENKAAEFDSCQRLARKNVGKRPIVAGMTENRGPYELVLSKQAEGKPRTWH